DFTVTQHANPAAFRQGAHDIRVDSHAADVLDLAAGDRLPVGNQGKGLEQGARVTGRPLLPQFRQAGRVLATDLQAPAARDFDQFHRPPLAFLGERSERLAYLRGIRPLELVEYGAELLDAERLPVRQQGR